MDDFSEKLSLFFSEFGKGRKMVLSTAADGIVSSRMMSVVLLDGCFCFQTDITLRKYGQLMSNPNAALCIDNIQIEGVCSELGRPLSHPGFCTAFRECFRGSYDAYTSLENERLFALKPALIQRWIYKDSQPYIETFDIRAQTYSLKIYEGV